MKSYKNIVVIIGILLLGFVSILTTSRFTKPVSSSDRYSHFIKGDSPKTFSYIRSNLSSIIKDLGIEDTIHLLKYGFKEEKLTMYECHTLAHMTGHFSRLHMDTNIQIAKEIGLDFCEGGFKHGLEAQIALEGLRFNKPYKEHLLSFCEQLSKVTSNNQSLDCYHGAGHEFMNETMDPKKALTLCEELTQHKLIVISNCYKGVFSELTNMVGGVDGQTGENLANGPPITIKEHPIEYCSSLEEKYQEPCGLELSGYLNNRMAPLSEVETILLKCIDPKYSEKLQAVCLQSLSAVSAQHLLPLHKTLTPPGKILSLPSSLQKSYILGAGTEMREFIKNGQKRDWETFCSPFTGKEKELCVNVFTS